MTTSIISRWGSDRILFSAEGSLKEVCESAALAGARLNGALLGGADLRGADLRGIDFCDAELRQADLRRVDLRQACLRQVNFRGADLDGADLDGADLKDAVMVQALLSGTCLIDGGQRSDGYRHIGQMRDGVLWILAGCHYMPIAKARAHWQVSREGKDFSAESLAMCDHIERIAKIRGLLE